jgi:hypothetical protein
MNQGKQNYLLKSTYSQCGRAALMTYLNSARANSMRVKSFIETVGHEKNPFSSNIDFG